MILGLLFLTSCQTFHARNQQQAQLFHRIALGHIDSGNLPGAFSALFEAQKLDPEDPQIQNTLGMTYFLKERLDLAELHFKQALAFKKDFTDAKNNLGRVYVEKGRHDEAQRLFKEANSDLTYPYPEKPLLNLGISHFKKSEFNRAIPYLSKSIELKRENCLAHNYYGRSLLEMKEYERAAINLDRAVAYCQRMQFDEPHYFSAVAHLKSGDQTKAIARLEEVLKLYQGGAYGEKAQVLLKSLK